MIALIVDDEPLAMKQLYRLLKESRMFSTIVTFNDAVDASEYVKNNAFDIAFLDIEMPIISGIELADSIQSLYPHVHIVFITAFDEYAVKAFEMNALDYIVKPVTKQRLKISIERAQFAKTSAKKEQTKKQKGMIHCFGSLAFTISTEPLKEREVKWRTSKARELFCYLLHYRNKIIRKDIFLDLFWPESDIKRANTQFYSTIYQIRKTLHTICLDIKLTRYETGYQLELQDVLVDVDEWETSLQRLGNIKDDNIEKYLEMMGYYTQPYFDHYDYVWAESEKMRLHHLWLQHAQQIVAFLIEKKAYERAIKICYKIQTIDPYQEQIYHTLIDLYNKIGNIEAAIEQYSLLQKIKQDIT